MMSERKFGGFTEETFGFLNELERNNNREWFEEHRGVFEQHILEPSQEFVVEMGERLRAISPKIIAIPKTDKSIFRLYRDTRFSEDKTPYKTHVGILFWEGRGKKLENSSYYLQLNKNSIFLGAGFYIFPNHLLGPYRESVVHEKQGAELRRILKRITAKPSYKIGGQHYKRIPRGYNQDHPNADLMLHNGLYAYYETPLPGEIYSDRFLDYCLDVFREMSPLHKWLTGLYK